MHFFCPRFLSLKKSSALRIYFFCLLQCTVHLVFYSCTSTLFCKASPLPRRDISHAIFSHRYANRRFDSKCNTPDTPPHAALLHNFAPEVHCECNVMGCKGSETCGGVKVVKRVEVGEPGGTGERRCGVGSLR